MLNKSPSGALSPYYYKGGYFHGIHYGSYFNDKDSLFQMIDQEEDFILSSPERRRILIDLYETDITEPVLEKLIHHIENLNHKIIKLAIAGESKKLRMIKRAIKKNEIWNSGCFYFCGDMEKAKTWLVSDC